MKLHSTLGLLSVVALLSLSAAPAALAGDGADWLWGGGVHLGLPTGDFDQAVDEGWGAAGHFVVLPHARPFGLRGEVSALVYGGRSYGIDDDWDGTDVRTDTWFGNMLLGPELRARGGVVRPYLHLLAGLGYFATSTESHGDWSGPHDGSTQFDDTTFAWAVGGGVEIALSSDVSVDLGARYLANGEVDYLTENDITGAAFTPRRGEANVICFTLGISFGR